MTDPITPALRQEGPQQEQVNWLRGIPREWFEEIRLAFLYGWYGHEQHAGQLSAEDVFALHVEDRALDHAKSAALSASRTAQEGQQEKPHFWTTTTDKNKCDICGDGPWGRHRFQEQP